MVRGNTNHGDVEYKKCKWSVGTQTIETQTMETLCLRAFVVKKKTHRGNTNFGG